MRHDPRIRQNLDRISNSLESAADNARTGCFTFTKSYIEPCLSSIVSCCTTCIPPPKAAHHRHRDRYARRAEYPFGFYEYEDWESEEDEGRGFLRWGTDELDRLLAGSGSAGPSSRNERMFYGAVDGPSSGLRRKGTLPPSSPDPTVIPGTSMFGFLSKFGVRGKGMKYKPSAANLQEHPQRGGVYDESIASTINGRKRSGTGSSSASQGDSLRSRGDLWPSEDEDDAVVIGDDAFPRSSDGESGQTMTLGVDYDDLLVDTTDYERKRRRGSRQVTMEPAARSDIRALDIGRGGSSSAPPTVLAASPEQYPAGLGIIDHGSRSREGSVRSHLRGSMSPRAMSMRAPKSQDVDNNDTDVRPQMRQVPAAPSPLPSSSPQPAPLSEEELPPKTDVKTGAANDDEE